MKKKVRVYLRAFEGDDYIKIHKWRQDTEISRNFSGVPLFSSSLNEKKWVEDKIFDKNNVSCAICLKETNDFIGCIFLNDIDFHNRTGHIPIFIGEKEFWGKGFATDARMLMLKYAFFDRGLNRIWARVLDGNEGALKMLEKTGYKIEGKLKQANFSEGKLHDEYYLAVLKQDFEKVMVNYEF